MSKEGEVKKNFFCDQCPSGFAEKKNLNKHIKKLHKPKKYFAVSVTTKQIQIMQ